MNRLLEIEQAIGELSPGELMKLRQWLADREEEELDRDFERDVRARRRDALPYESLSHLGVHAGEHAPA